MEIHLKEFKMTFKGSKRPRTRTPSRLSKQGQHPLRRRPPSGRDSKFTAVRSGFVSLLFVVMALALLGGLVLLSGLVGAPVEVRFRIDRSGSVVLSGTLTQEYDGPVLRE